MEDLVAFLSDPASWQGTTGILVRLSQHLAISAASVAVATALALPVGLWMGHTGRFALVGVNAANIGRALPSYAVMAMILPLSLTLAPTFGYDPQLGLTLIPILLAMIVLAIPPILVAAFVGVRSVDRDLVEAARGMGLRERQILTSVELPLASGVIVGGFRTAVLQVIATATLGAIFAYGGLGRLIIDGLARREPGSVFAGALLVSSMAIGTDVLLSRLQHRLTPRALRDARLPDGPMDARLGR